MKELALLIVAIGFSFIMIGGTLIVGYLAYKSMREWE
jgi:hypothetical protein|tara:strand:+ start:533 stop:643 length:111 start_codon:yes stop_codon:yes gene_type:complete